MTGAAHAGKLRPYQDYFGERAAPAGGPQTADQMKAALRLLAAAWGAEYPAAVAGKG